MTDIWNLIQNLNLEASNAQKMIFSTALIILVCL